MPHNRKPDNLTNLLIAVLALLMTTACIFSSDREAGPEKSQKSPEASPTAAVSPEKEKKESESAKKNEDKGDFRVQSPSVKSSRFVDVDRKVKDERLLENAAADLNRALILPEDIFVTAKECGERNAQFDPNDQTITICYDLMEHFYNLYRSDGMSSNEADKKMFDAIRFVFLHEVGHALIYNYKLPVVGNEEDAADRCSSYINIEELGDSGVRAVIAAADGFRIESRQESRSKRQLADEHLLQEQRYYNSLCMIYGSKPEKYRYFVTDGYLPEERAVRCRQEYTRTVDSWVNLLAPWRKDR